MWLDNCLSFNAHIGERLGKAKIAKSRIRRLNKTYGPPLRMIRQIQVMVIKSVALYGAEIW